MEVKYIQGLRWPEGKERYIEHEYSLFKDRSIEVAMQEVIREARVKDRYREITLTGEWTLGKKGKPLMGGIADLAVAVYLTDHEGRITCLAIDTYTTIQDNLWAIARTIECLRLIENHAGSGVYAQATAGFAALPPSVEPPRDCWSMLGLAPDADKDLINAAYRTKARSLHPDAGGDADEFRRLTDAKDECLRRIG